MITGLVLAAGAGRRLGQPKAELLLGGQRLVDRAIGILTEGGCDEVLAVLRSAQVEVTGARAVLNPNPDQGMGSSLRCGLAATGEASTACVVLLVDLPMVRPVEVAATIQAHRDGADLVAVRRAGSRSHPVLVARRWYADFAAAAAGDRGGRRFFAEHAGQTVFLDYPEPIWDIDTPQDLRLAEFRLNGPAQPEPRAPSGITPPAE